MHSYFEIKTHKTKQYVIESGVKLTLKMVKVLALFMLCTFLIANDYQTYIARGDQYFNQFENIKALAEYERAYKQSPDQYEALMKLIRAYNDSGEDLGSDESEAYYEQAVYYSELLKERFPDRAKTYFYLSISYGNLALYRGGQEKVKLSRSVESNAKKAIELNPEFDRPYVVMGVYYREVANLNWFLKTFANSFLGGLPDGTNEDSEKMLLKAIELNPNNLYAHYQLGKTYEVMGNINKAAGYYRIVLELPIIDHQDKMKKTEAKEKLGEL